jgi:hypothetical protein
VPDLRVAAQPVTAMAVAVLLICGIVSAFASSVGPMGALIPLAVSATMGT